MTCRYLLYDTPYERIYMKYNGTSIDATSRPTEKYDVEFAFILDREANDEMANAVYQITVEAVSAVNAIQQAQEIVFAEKGSQFAHFLSHEENTNEMTAEEIAHESEHIMKGWLLDDPTGIQVFKQNDRELLHGITEEHVMESMRNVANDAEDFLKEQES